MKRTAAFSLLELLVVIAIIGLLAALVVPAATSVSRGREVELAATQLVDGIGLARQTAVAKSRGTEVRFFRHPGRNSSEEKFRSFQVFELLDDGSSRPLARPVRLPETMEISDQSTWSSVFGAGGLAQMTATNIVGIGPVSDVRILGFRASGRTSLPNLSSNYFLTTLPVVSSQTNNFATVQIDPLNGRTRVFRP